MHGPHEMHGPHGPHGHHGHHGPRREDGERRSEMGSIGVLQGVPPGAKIHHAGVLDFRGVPADRIAQVEEIGSADVLLLDNENRNALQNVRMHHVRSVLIAAPDERVLVTPQLDLSRSAVEAMPDAQRLLIVGNVYLSPDVGAELAASKFALLRVIGSLTAGAGALGALAGRALFGNGVTVALPEDAFPLVRNFGELRMTREYVEELPDGATYLNFGEVEVRGNVPTELLRQKIRAYYNCGETKADDAALGILRARCPLDTGEFHSR